MLKVQDIAFQYGETEVFKDISFEVPHGKLCALFGPNGTGKTTLFKCCLRFLKINSGMISVDGTRIADQSSAQLARRMAYVPQEHKLSFPYTVKEIVLMGRTPHLGGSFGVQLKDQELATEAMCLLGILPLADRPYNQLSGGQRQLVLIARAVAQQTQLLLLDEPTASLDFDNQLLIWKILRQLSRQGKTILVGTHDPNHVLWFCDQVIVIGKQQKIADGPPREALNARVLDQLYGNECRMLELGAIQMVVPALIDKGTDG